jgi:flagellar motor switch protein FliG
MPLADASLRNAAVLVSCLDDEDADELLGLVGLMPARRIREAISGLGRVSRLERDRVIRAFLLANEVPGAPPTPASAASATATGGVELDEGLARHFAPTGEHESAAETIRASDAPEAPFAFLLETEAEVVAPLLARESPQTVAVVLSCLRRSQAAELLKRLDPPLQSQVLARLARLEDIDPACIEVVADGLRAWIERSHAVPRPRLGADGLLREMLSGRKERGRAALMAELEREVSRDAPGRFETEPARPTGGIPAASFRAQLRPESRRSLQFDELIILSDEELRRTFQDSPRDVLVLALVGAEERLIRRITKCISRREAKQVKRGLRLESPTRLGDIEAAKRRIAQIATEVVYGRAASNAFQ